MDNIILDCKDCANKRNVPGDCHVQCVKPDGNMTGNQHGIRNGWFMYPLLFDPIWATKKCDNFESVNLAVESTSQSL
jgi:hypothetical protein